MVTNGPNSQSESGDSGDQVRRPLTIEYAGVRDETKSRRAAAAPPSLWSMLWLAIGWTVIGVALLAGFYGLMAAALSPLAGWLASPILLLILTSVAMMMRRLRANRAMAVLAYVEQAVRLNLPLPRMLLAAEQSERGGVRRGLARAREQLEIGGPVAGSLGFALAGLPLRAQALVAAGERSGRLPQALRRVLAQWHGRGRAGPTEDPSTGILLRWYPLLLLTGVGAIGLMLLIFVMPKYRSIMNDFGLPLPPITLWFVTASEWLIWVGPPVVILVLLIQVGRLVGETVMPGRWRHNPFDAVAGWLAWHVPPFRGLARGRALADACHVIADALEAGHPLHRAVEEAGDLHVNNVLRRRLRRWADQITNGSPPGEAARAARLPPLIAGMLGPSVTASGNPAAAVRYLARHYDARFSRTAALLRAAAMPMLTLAGGAVVGALALSMFQPLVALMENLSQAWPGTR